jgi:hypothetical protein
MGMTGGKCAVGPVGSAYGSANVPLSASETATASISQRVCGTMCFAGTLVRKKLCSPNESTKMLTKDHRGEPESLFTNVRKVFTGAMPSSQNRDLPALSWEREIGPSRP